MARMNALLRKVERFNERLALYPVRFRNGLSHKGLGQEGAAPDGGHASSYLILRLDDCAVLHAQHKLHYVTACGILGLDAHVGRIHRACVARVLKVVEQLSRVHVWSVRRPQKHPEPIESPYRIF